MTRDDVPQQPAPTVAAFRELIASNNDAAWSSFLLRYSSLLHETACRISGNYHWAEDITQQVLLEVRRQGEHFTFPDPHDEVVAQACLRAWLIRITSGIAISFCRSERSRRRREHLATSGDTAPHHDEEPVDPDALRGMLRQLPETLREPLILRFFDGMTYDTIGRVLGYRRQKAQYLVEQGLLKLRWKLADGRQVGLAAVLAVLDHIARVPVGLGTPATIPAPVSSGSVGTKAGLGLAALWIGAGMLGILAVGTLWWNLAKRPLGSTSGTANAATPPAGAIIDPPFDGMYATGSSALADGAWHPGTTQEVLSAAAIAALARRHGLAATVEDRPLRAAITFPDREPITMRLPYPLTGSGRMLVSFRAAVSTSATATLLVQQDVVWGTPTPATGFKPVTLAPTDLRNATAWQQWGLIALATGSFQGRPLFEIASSERWLRGKDDRPEDEPFPSLLVVHKPPGLIDHAGIAFTLRSAVLEIRPILRQPLVAGSAP